MGAATTSAIGAGAGLGWLGIVRLGLVQAAIGAQVMLSTSLLNRVMVVEYGLAAAIPAGLVAWHYAVQLSRPLWGHGSDRASAGGKGGRTGWIIGGMAVLGAGSLLATMVPPMLASGGWAGIALAVLAFAMIGAGVGASGTSLLALLARAVAPQRRAAAAAITWIMMIAGIIVAAATVGSLIEPYSLGRMQAVAAGLVATALLVTIAALLGIEAQAARSPAAQPAQANAASTNAPLAGGAGFRDAIVDLWADREARRFTFFVFLSMLAYSMQDLILEPFAGLIFGMSPGESTRLSGVQHMGVLVGMILVGVGGSAFGTRLMGGSRAGGDRASTMRSPAAMRGWIIAGCLGSAVMLGLLAVAAQVGGGWPLQITVVALGFANGMFAVAAIGAMMGLAGTHGGAEAGGREGIRMGVWGAAQAIAFGLGGLTGAVAVDVGRAMIGDAADAFSLTFLAEAVLFTLAAMLAMGMARAPRSALAHSSNTLPNSRSSEVPA